MDSNRVLIGFVMVVVAFLAFPIVANKMRAQNGGAVLPVSSGTSTPVTAPDPEAAYPELKEPPLLNEQNLVGTEWQVQVEQYKVKVTVAPNGVAYATHPMAKALTGMDYVEGRWRVQQGKLFVNASMGGNDLSIELRIAGAKLFTIDKRGKPTEVKRY